MAVGSLLLRRIKANAVVTVETATTASEGGTVVTWAAAKTGVDVAVSNLSMRRAFDSGTANQVGSCSVTGVDPLLSRPDVRLKVTAAGVGLAQIVGLYLSVESTTFHPQGNSGLVPARVSASCSVYMLPANTGG